MHVHLWTILAILSSIIVFANAAKKEFTITEICENLQEQYKLFRPMFYGLPMEFKKYNRHLRGKGRFTGTSNLTFSDCEAERQSNGTIILSVTLKDDETTIIFDDRPWVELTDPVVKIDLNTQNSGYFRSLKFVSLEFDCSDVLINNKPLDDTEADKVKLAVTRVMKTFAKSHTLEVSKGFQLRKSWISLALQEMFEFYMYRLTS